MTFLQCSQFPFLIHGEVVALPFLSVFVQLSSNSFTNLHRAEEGLLFLPGIALELVHGVLDLDF